MLTNSNPSEKPHMYANSYRRVGTDIKGRIARSTAVPRWQVLFLAVSSLLLWCYSFFLDPSAKTFRKYDDIQLPYNYEGPFRSYTLNETLGFGKIFVLNLPSRIDRRNAMSLMALATGLEIDLFKASDGTQVASARLPPIDLLPYVKEDQSELTSGQLGCYLSNVNIMHHIVANRIESALILQDDAEWDLDLKGSLHKLQEPLSILLDQFEDEAIVKSSKESPWKEKSWDILWLGPSYERPWPDAASAPYIKYEDENVANSNFAEEGGQIITQEYDLRRRVDNERSGERIVQLSRRPLGMAAYAVSLAGAARILARTSHEPIRQSYDNTICAMSRPNTVEGYEGLACEIARPSREIGESELRSFTVWPPLVSQFRNSDGVRDSDLVSMRSAAFHIDGSVGYALEIREGIREKILSGRYKWS